MKQLILLVLLWNVPLYAQLPTSIGWSQLTNTKISDVCACTHGFSSVCGVEYCGGIESWSGGVFDSTRNRLIVWGGGHAAYYGNEVYALNLNATPPTMTRLNDPSSPSPLCTAAYADGKPSSRHTYDQVEYLPNVDRMFVFAGAYACLSGGGTSDTWTLNLSTLAWTQHSPSGPNPANLFSTVSAYDPVTGKLFLHDDFDLYTYTYATNTYAKLTSNGSGHTGGFNGALDTKRKQFVYLGNDSLAGTGKVYSYDITGPTYTRVQRTTTGGSGIINTSYPGVDYDPVLDRIVAWNGGNTVYLLNLDTNVWTTQTFSTNPGAPAYGGGTNGIHGRFRYSRESGVFTLVNGPSNDAWILRLSSPADVDFYKRCTAAGVVRCFDFDDTADFTQCSGGTNGCYGQNYGLIPRSGTTDYSRITRDTGTFASGSSAGASSMKMTMPSNSSADASGSWHTNFSTDLLTQFGANSTFYVQWRQRFDTAYATTFIQESPGVPQGGIKHSIVTTGDTATHTWASCEATTLVTETYYQKIPRFLKVYNSCTGSTSHAPYEGMYEVVGGGTDFKLQNAMPSPFCLFTNGGATGCFYWFANEWMTFKMRVDVGPRLTTGAQDEWLNSRTRFWMAREGQPAQLIIDWQPGVPGYFNLTAGPPSEDQKFGKIWLLPYMTGKDPTQSHTPMNTWYDELIISTQDIADPGFPAAVGSGAPAPPTGLQKVD